MSISSGTVFSKLDAKSGFHQVILMDESAKLKQFITPVHVQEASILYILST